MKDIDDMGDSLIKRDMTVRSSSDEHYPSTPPPKFKAFASPVSSPISPPPVYPPPPAYVPGTPLRNAFVPAAAEEGQLKRQESLDPFDDSARVEEAQDPETLMREIQQIIQSPVGSRPTSSSENPFVIADEVDDGDSLSDCSL